MNLPKAAKIALGAAAGVLLIAGAVLLLAEREDRVDLLFAVSGDSYDQAAYDNFRQTLAANADVDKKPITGLSLKQLKQYDAVYLDDQLKHSNAVHSSRDSLIRYVEQGGHLFLENSFASDFPAEFLGASQVSDVPAPKELKDLELTYPEVDLHLRGMQQVFELFMGNFTQQMGLDFIPGFQWGKGLVPSTAETLVAAGQLSLMTSNRYGEGTVMLSSAILPNRYFITGFDLQSGMDPAAGFDAKIADFAKLERVPGDTYFQFKKEQPLKPYFHFAFATANYQLRNEYLAYVSKEKLGYSLKKVHGPYGRPAMAYQNHFEVANAYKNKEGIQWAEFLKDYNQIPSFSLVRAAYNWNLWYEDITVHLNEGTQDKPVFTGQYANSFYGSGVRLVTSDTKKPLTLAQYPEVKQLADPITLPYRAYPAFADLNGDGKPELAAGSADGTVSLYRVGESGGTPGSGGTGSQANAVDDGAAYASQPLPAGVKPPSAFEARQPLLTEAGQPLELVAGYAAPAFADLNGDARPDLLIGDKDGRVWHALNRGGERFSAPEPLVLAGAQSAGNAAPAVGDFDGDGTSDLLVGDGDGRVLGYRGKQAADGALHFEEGTQLLQHSSRFAAPAVRDMNGDGRPDLTVGSNAGDVQVFIRQDNGNYKNEGPVNGTTRNQVGSAALVGGHNSVPVWIDLNGDGMDDLIVGQLEFGLPVPLDDPSFPYQEELQAFIQYAQDNKLELYPHLFFHSYAWNEQEQEEIRLHRSMFEKLGIPWTLTGTNQHTWRTNNADRLQTLQNENAAGLWFNFGFRPANNPLDPQYGQDYIWSMPFLLNSPDLKHPMVLGAPAYLLRLNGESYPSEDVYKSYVKLDMPINYFDHIENKLPGNTKELLKYVTYMDRIRNDHDYNFMTEPQMAQSFLTTLTAKVTAKQSWATYLWNKVKNKLGEGKHLSLTLTADTSDVPDELAAAYKDTMGVAIEPGKPYLQHPFAVDSDIFLEKGTTLYTGLQRPVKLSVSWAREPFHLLRSNVPFKLYREGSHLRLDLQADGMQQIKLYSPNPLRIDGEDLKIDKSETDNTYTVTHYGSATSITLTYILLD